MHQWNAADENQLKISFQPSKKFEEATIELQLTIVETRKYFLTHQLQLNPAKTELILIGSDYQCSKLSNISIEIGNTLITLKKYKRYLGIIFDKNVSIWF